MNGSHLYNFSSEWMIYLRLFSYNYRVVLVLDSKLANVGLEIPA
jgi:hypothetical protein